MADKLARVLTKQIGPGTPSALSPLGIEIMPRDNPVLLYLAKSDEREYKKMLLTDDAISGATEQRVTGLLAEGSEIVPGNDSPAALNLQAFAVAQLKAIDNLPQVLAEILDARWYGWRPCELQWTSELSYNGRPWWGVERIVVRDPWHYALTPDGAVVDQTFATLGGDLQVYDSPEERLRWLVAVSGSTSSPYGDGELNKLWLLYFLSKKFENMSGKLMQRALGVLKAKNTAAAPIGEQKQSQALSDVKRILDVLNSNNVLMEYAGWTLEMIDGIDFSGDVIKTLEYFDERKRIKIVGQNLTTKVTGGSYAAAKEHSKVLEAKWKSDAKFLASVINDGLLRRILELNLGEIDPEDLPKWTSLAFSKPDLEATKAYYDMGGPVDRDRFAHSYNIPIPEDGADPETVLQREPGAPAVFGHQTFQGAPVQNNGPGASRSRTAAEPPDPVLRSGTLSELERYYRSAAERFLEDNPDPKGQGRRA